MIFKVVDRLEFFILNEPSYVARHDIRVRYGINHVRKPFELLLVLHILNIPLFVRKNFPLKLVFEISHFTKVFFVECLEVRCAQTNVDIYHSVRIKKRPKIGHRFSFSQA
jgi:hypothetical protein